MTATLAAEARAVRLRLLDTAFQYRQLGNLAAIGSGLQVDLWAAGAQLEAEARVLLHTRTQLEAGITAALTTLARFDPQTPTPTKATT